MYGLSSKVKPQPLIETRLFLIEFAAGHTMDELLMQALDEVCGFVDSPIGFFHFVEPDQETISLQSWSTRTLNEFCRTGGKSRHDCIEHAGVWAGCVKKRRPVIHNDYAALPHKKGLPEGHAKIIRELVVPVLRDDKVVAILGVGNKPDLYTKSDVKVVSFLADVTWEIVNRKRAEEELQRSNEMLRAIIDAAPTAIAGLDLDGNVHSVNLKHFESMDRVNRAIQGATDLEQMMHDVLDEVLSILDCERAYLMYPCDPSAAAWTVPMERSKPGYDGPAYTQKLTVSMSPEYSEILRLMIDTGEPLKIGPGTEHPVSVSDLEHHGFQSSMATALHPKIGKAWQFGIHQCSSVRTWTVDEEMLVREIGRRLTDGLTSLLMYRDLQESEKFLGSIVENIPNMIFVKDAETLKFLRFNRAGEKLLGYSRDELLGKNDYDFFPKEEADQFAAKDREVLDAKALLDIPEEKIRTRRNDERILQTKKIPILDETGKPQYLLGISEDITERKTLEKQFRQAQKMESVGRLAGGVAHDFNNLLSVILGNVELALGRADQDRQVTAYLHGIQRAAESSADLTRQLLAFARKQTIAPRTLDLNRTVEGMLKMLRRLIGEDINLSWQPFENVWPVKMDPSQIDQILANLCVNARDAIENVGKITIETNNIIIDEAYCADHAGFRPGAYALLAVSDNGCGMDHEILDKIFEPFFTTKELGKGTGLGLATVYGIVKQNNGFINAYSKQGRGSTFKIYFPRQESDVDQASKKKEPLSMVQGNETILVVEDEPTVLELACKILNRLGYRVLFAISPEDAIRVAEEYGDVIHLLITDVVMPGMNGPDLASTIKVLQPEIASLFMSGYTEHNIAHHAVLDEGFNFIQKPFSAQILSEKIREILEKG